MTVYRLLSLLEFAGKLYLPKYWIYFIAEGNMYPFSTVEKEMIFTHLYLEDISPEIQRVIEIVIS